MNENNNDIIEVEYTEEDKKQLHRRVFKMISVAGITLIVLIVATYAWFIGITTVNVEQFQVQIETLEGLQISFDGDNFADTASIDSTNYNNMGIVNNNWVEAGKEGGLKPVSSSGEFDASGHLKLYQNSSVTAITGGYRLRTTKVPNTVAEQTNIDANFNDTTTSPEQKQYITFDLFLKNNTNTQGTTASNSAYNLDEAEAIYLTTNSKVELVRKGADGSPSTTFDPNADATTKTNWLENSVRVGFYQIAYAPLTTQQANLQAMGCTTDSTNNTVGVCSESGVRANRTYSWNIWEPNDLRHMGKALAKYNNLCKVRDDTTGDYDATTACNSISDGVFYNTYAVNKIINVNDVNIYDGFNGYTQTIGANNYLYNTGSDANLTPQKGTLRSSENVLNQTDVYLTNRESVLKIAPNSITKIRVYIWLEGQDIDNLEYDSNELYNLRFSFGFTKDMFELPLQTPETTTEP